MPFNFRELEIPGVILVEPRLFPDHRGFFMEAYKQTDFAGAGIAGPFVQDNYSRSTRNVLRGLHFQKSPMQQGKLVRCLRGSVFDVAVDIRKGSPTFGKWVGTVLSEDNNQMLYVPPDFAHGFLVLSDIADVSYKCTSEYSQEYDRGIIWSDPDINISWPADNPLVSDKDAALPRLKDADI